MGQVDIMGLACFERFFFFETVELTCVGLSISDEGNNNGLIFVIVRATCDRYHKCRGNFVCVTKDKIPSPNLKIVFLGETL